MVANRLRWVTISVLIFISLFAFLLQGYHPGSEDDGIYLSAIKKDLRPDLYPFNSDFITAQLQATVFDKFVALVTRWMHLPLAYVAVLLQLAAIGLLLAGCWRIAAFCFPSFVARCAGVLIVACVLTLSVAGTAIYVSDEHLHPRTIATDAILFAIAALQRRRWAQVTVLLFTALIFHPIMAAFGISFCIVHEAVRRTVLTETAIKWLSWRAAIFPAPWFFAPETPAWKLVVQQPAHALRLPGWHWYEWLGALAPPLVSWLLARLARRRRNLPFFHLAATVAVYSVVQFLVALAMLLPPGLERLAPLQPMRYLHLTFLLMALLAGASLGEYVLRAHVARWLLVFLPLAALNGYAQRLRYPATPNLELPWLAPRTPWLRAFQWIRINTPKDAVFALDPNYLALPGEDNHSFRALAERSSLADDKKDAAVATQVPSLAPTWLLQHNQQAGWTGWTRRDFLHLARTTPVRWVVVAPAQAFGLRCPYHDDAVWVCKLGGGEQP